MITAQTMQPFIPTNSTLIIGFSGGPDSVCLLSLLVELAPKLNLKLIAAHLDHQWRQESFKDALWCKKFCTDRGNITCVIKTPTDLNFQVKYNGSQEELGRKLRRTFLQDLAAQFQADHIVLAHHADDQLETFFIRLARGSSLTGLTGMKTSEGLFLRPMLHIKKEEILKYLHHHQIEYLTDPTNLNPKYLRNRIRHELMPQLANIDHRFPENLKHCMTHLKKTDDFIHQTMLQILQKISKNSMLNTHDFLQLHEILQHKILMHLLIQQNIAITPSNALFQEIVRFLGSHKNQQHQIHPTCSIIKQADHFYFKSL
ncbi:tRNA lysidine(34) synthetase TilS [candidate division TM6 bacterium RIFCSPHIGHO2_12_FULL_38_8]|nr:MAG: tRNA lysidine(34) synthetase TilS [candidate division TM6 bacterium RIFCSPHIGHO2_12_FULL_38_8]